MVDKRISCRMPAETDQRIKELARISGKKHSEVTRLLITRALSDPETIKSIGVPQT